MINCVGDRGSRRARSGRAPIVLLFVAFFMTTGAAGAQTLGGSDRKEGEAQVQLLAFLAPIRNRESGSVNNASITVFLQVPDRRNVAYICRLSPRLRDAILQVLYRHPPTVGADRRLEFGELPTQLVEAANRALDRDLVSAVHIEEGARHMKTGGARFASAIPWKEVR